MMTVFINGVATEVARGPIDLSFGVGKHARDKGELLTGSERSIATRQGLLHGSAAQLSCGEVNWVQQKKGKSGERARRDHYPRMMLLSAVDVDARRHMGGIVAAQAEVGGPPLQQFPVCSGAEAGQVAGDAPCLTAELLQGLAGVEVPRGGSSTAVRRALLQSAGVRPGARVWGRAGGWEGAGVCGRFKGGRPEIAGFRFGKGIRGDLGRTPRPLCGREGSRGRR